MKPKLTVEGAVKFDGGYMHPETYRQLMGEAAYQELLKGPIVQSEYTDCECSACQAIRQHHPGKLL